MIEVNDTLEITDAQGFPSDLLDLERHRKKPMTLGDVQGRTFEFQLKPEPRIYQVAGVRVYYVHNIGGKWLFWGHVFILSQTIDVAAVSPSGDYSFVTSGRYQIVELYDPAYQEAFTRRESPPGLSWFGGA
jgi:hypothetical protein